MKLKKLKKLCARLALGFTLSLGLTSVSSLSAYAEGTFNTVTYNDREYKLYIPSGYTVGSNLPLVVMLHGCVQNPDDFATGTQMNTLAETENFLVMYPAQSTTANANKCWNFFDPAHQSRGSGEPALIAGMVDDVKSKYSVDSNHVFVAGLSAGGAMSAIMGATYPDVFKAIAVGSGLEYKAATDMLSAFSAMRNGSSNDPNQQGVAAYDVMGSYKRVVPTIVFHGTSDATVVPKNGDQVLTQWAETNDLADDGISNNSIDDVADQTINIPESGSLKAYTRYIYNDNTGKPIMEKYMVTGMTHAWSGGNTAGSYTDPNGPDQSRIIWDFFKLTIPITLKSIDAEDGFAGALFADGYGTAVKLGDKGMYNTDTYRGVLSFDTSSLGTTTVSSAKLRIYRKALTGNVTGIKVDIKSGFFGTASTLTQTAYNAAASATDIATMSVPTSNNAYVEIALPTSALQYINKSGKTQFRLKAIAGTDIVSDVLEIYGGDNSTYAAQLIVN